LNVKAYLEHEIAVDPECNDWESWEWLMCIESSEYLKRAHRVHVDLFDIPLPENSLHHWKQASDGENYLPYPTLTKFKRMVEDAEYERDKRGREKKELYMKGFAAFFAIIAALASAFEVYLTYRKK